MLVSKDDHLFDPFDRSQWRVSWKHLGDDDLDAPSIVVGVPQVEGREDCRVRGREQEGLEFARAVDV